MQLFLDEIAERYPPPNENLITVMDGATHKNLSCRTPSGHFSFRPTALNSIPRKLFGSKKLATGLQACRSNVFWKGFASPPKTVAETPAVRKGFSSHRPKGRGFKPELVIR
jgi:hypothetical protein